MPAPVIAAAGTVVRSIALRVGFEEIGKNMIIRKVGKESIIIIQRTQLGNRYGIGFGNIRGIADSSKITTRSFRNAMYRVSDKGHRYGFLSFRQIGGSAAGSQLVRKLLPNDVKDYAKIARRLVKKHFDGVHSPFNKSMHNVMQHGMHPSTRVSNLSEFNRKLTEYAVLARKDIAKELPRRGFNIALKAFKYTYKADKGTIRSALNLPSNTVPDLSVAEFMAVRQLTDKNGKRPSKAEVKQEARKLINLRINATQFLKSGWIPAIRNLSRYANKTLNTAIKRRGKDKGGSSTNGIGTDRPVVRLWNDIVADNDNKTSNYLKAGLDAALAGEMADMQKYIDRKLSERAKRV